MSVIKDLAVEYHQQDTDYYCGAACAQMVLQEIGAGHLPQDDLYNDNHTHSITESGWASGPDGLTWTMNHRKPASFANYFVLFEQLTEDSISRKIVWTIYHYGVAPIAMVYGWAHWIVIRGYDISAAPVDYADSSYLINGFYVNNPWPPTPSPGPPPPHSTGDICGSGGIYGVANEHIAYGTWQTDYMTGVPSGHWAGKYLAVCDPDPAPQKMGRKREIRREFDGERILDKQTAARWALTGLRDSGLARHDRLKELVHKVEPGEPILVQRLDRKNDFYYITPMSRAGRNIDLLVSIDARFADYKQTSFTTNEESSLSFQPLSREEILRMLGRRVVVGKEVIPIHPEAICIYPTLVWRPCEESLSPFWPFHMVTIGQYRLYIRIDGAIFTSLTSKIQGI